MALKLYFERRRLELAFTWALSRNSSTYKDNFIIGIDIDGAHGFGESAPNIRYGETPDAVEAMLIHLAARVSNEEELIAVIKAGGLPHCVATGIDQAFTQAKSNQEGASTCSKQGEEQLLPTYPVSFTLPIMPAADVAALFERHGLARFSYLKVKVGSNQDAEVIAELGRLYTGPVLIDGNEAFRSIEELDRQVELWQQEVLIAALEQPFPADRPDLARELKGRYPIPILADEAAVAGVNLKELAEVYDGINIKLQKTGGYKEAFRQKNEAEALGMKVMVGCMVETSIGIWHGLHLVEGIDYIDLDNMLYLQVEPYGWVSEKAGHLKPASQLSSPFEMS